MKIYVRTTGDRSLEQFKNLDFIYLLDKERTGCKGYFNQLHDLSFIDDDILLLEDDIVLKSHFFTCLNDLIEMTDNRYIINMSQPGSLVRFYKAEEFYWTRAVYYPKGSLRQLISNFDEKMLKISEYYDIIQQRIMPSKYIGVPSVMNIIDLDCQSLMNYTKGRNKNEISIKRKVK